MSAFAGVKIQVDLTRRGGAAFAVQETAENFAGTRNVVVDASAGELRFDLQFPGNLSALVRQLQAASVPVGPQAEVSVPIRSLVDAEASDAAAVAAHVAGGVEVWDPQFPRGDYVFAARVAGDHLEASVEPSTSGMHAIYDALLTLGLVAQDEPSLPSLRGL
jgi:hypothetical protein